MADVFVSYKAEDRRRVKPLVDALEADGYSVWWDQQIGGGTAWRHTIEAALNAAKCVVVIWSKRSVGPDGGFVHDEATRAQKRHVYLPVTVDRVDPPLGFGEVQAIPLLAWNGQRSDRRYQMLLACVRATIEQRPRAGYRLVEEPARKTRRWRPWVLAAVAVSLAAFLFVWLTGGRRTAPQRLTTPTIAILPFTSASADPPARELASAAHDALAQALSNTEFSVRLIDAQPPPGNSVADFLIYANAVVTPEKALVTVRMEESGNRIVVYSKRFEANSNDVPALVDQIAGQVAGSLSWTVPELALDLRHPSDPAVLAEMFKEVDNYSSDLGALPNYATSRRLAAKAPNSAIVQGVLAINSAFVLPELPRDQRAEALALGRRAADRARALAPESGGNSIAWCQLHSRVRLTECEDRLRAGMRLDPDSAWVDEFLADYMKEVGRFQEAEGLARRSLARDQYTPGKIALALRMFEATGDLDGAERLFRRAQRWWPDDFGIFIDRLYGMAVRGDLEAIARFADENGRAHRFTGHGLVEELPKALRQRNLAAVRKMCPSTMPPLS